MRRPTISGIFLIAAGILIVLPQWLGNGFLILAGVCLVLAGLLSAKQ